MQSEFPLDSVSHMSYALTSAWFALPEPPIRALGLGLLAVLSLEAVVDDSALPPADANGVIIRPLGTTSCGLGFTVWFPPGYDAAGDTRWPVVLQFAGTGEQGDGTGDSARDQLYVKTTKYGAMRRAKLGSWPYPVIVVAPQSSNGWQSNEINSVVDYALTSWKSDPSRIYLTGLCQGGAATWAYAQAYASKVAAICPIQTSAGPGSPIALVDIPVWAFHSWGDWRYHRRNSVNWIDGLASAIAGVPVSCLATYPNAGGDPTLMAASTMTAQFNLASNTWIWHSGKPASAVPLADAGAGVLLTMYANSTHGTWYDVWDGNTEQMWAWLFAQAKPARAPWFGTAATIPGLVQAEAFDGGCGGSVWQDSDRANRGGALRQEGVDIVPTTDADGDCDVSDLRAGEFLSYTLACTADGICDLVLRVASASGGRLRVSLDGQNISGILQVPATGGDDVWMTVPVLTTLLRSGTRDLRIEIDTGGFRLNWFAFQGSSAPNAVVDNLSVGTFSTVGPWPVATTVAGFYGSNYAWAMAGTGLSATWTPTLPEAGYYQVYIRHPADATRSPSVPVAITHDQGVANTTVNQQVGGGAWKLLGTYPFTPGAGQGVGLTTAGTSKFVVADAVMFLKSYQTPPADLVVDNRDPRRFSTVGAWSTSWTYPGYHAGDYAFNQVIGAGGCSASFRPVLATAGYYKVYIMYAPGANRARAVPVEVTHADGVAMLSLDQRSGSGWVQLGTWSFPAGSAAAVTLRTDGTTDYVIADAVRFQATEEIPQVDLVIDNLHALATAQEGLWLPGTSVPGYFAADYLSGSAGCLGGLRREVWNAPVSTLAEIPVDTPPALSSIVTTFAAPSNVGDGYGQRLSGWLVAPTTGTYIMWIASDDDSALYLSADADPAGKVLVAQVRNSSSPLQWTATAAQQSDPVALVAGRRYYMEALHRAGTGADHLAVGWSRPGQSTSQASEVIPGSCLSTSNGSQPPPCFTFTPNLPKAGIYEVYLQHPANATRSPAVPVSVTHLDGTTIRAIDQRSNGGTWRLLGTWRFAAGSAGSVTVSTQGTIGWVGADAVRFKETSVLPPREVVIDNLDALQTERTGSWLASTTVAGFYATNYLYNATLGGGSSFSWIPQLDRDGYFEVAMWHPADANRDAAVQVEVVHADGRYAHYLDLTQRGGQWEVLGTFAFLKGGAGRVILRTDGTATYVMADAVRFREVTELPEPAPLSLIVDNAWTAFTSRLGTWSTSTSVPGYFAGNYAWCTTPKVGGAGFSFTPDLPHPGIFNVWIRQPASANRSAAVPVDLITGEDTTTTIIDQTRNGGMWQPLGTVALPAGCGTSVRVRCAGTTGYVEADAVWFEEVFIDGDG